MAPAPTTTVTTVVPASTTVTTAAPTTTSTTTAVALASSTSGEGKPGLLSRVIPSSTVAVLAFVLLIVAVVNGTYFIREARESRRW